MSDGLGVLLVLLVLVAVAAPLLLAWWLLGRDAPARKKPHGKIPR